MNNKILCWFLQIPLSALLITLAGNTYAQPSGARGEFFIYKVENGDNLIGIAKRFTSQSDDWKELQMLNSVKSPDALPIGSEIGIPFNMIPEIADEAKISSFSGEVLLNNQALKDNTRLLKEGDNIVTSKASTITIEMSDHSRITFPPNTNVTLKRLQKFKNTNLLDTIFNVHQGQIEAQADPTHKGLGRFEVQTPISITGVRGTIFRLSTNGKESQSMVLKGLIDVSTNTSDNTRYTKVPKNFGAALAQNQKTPIVRALLPAPSLQYLKNSSQGPVLSISPVKNAVAYTVSISKNREGTQLIKELVSKNNLVSLSGLSTGKYYAIVRPIDNLHITGLESSLTFDIISVVADSDNKAVHTNFGGYILRQDY